MKRYFTLLILGLTILSCSKQLDEVNTYQEGKQVIYTAVQENRTEDPNTKTSVDNTGTVYWSAGDKISMFYGSSSAMFTSQNTEKSIIATFVGYLPVIIGGNEGASSNNVVMGLYPYDANATCTNGIITTTFSNKQKATDNSFAEKSFPTVAKTSTTNNNLSFYNVCGGIRFTVGTEGIKKVIVSGNNGEEIAGKIGIQFNDKGKPEVTEITEGKTEITLSSESGLTIGTSYYITILPRVFTKGVTIRLETDAQYAEKVFTTEKEIKRSTWANVGQVDSGLEWNPLVQSPLKFTSNGSTSISLCKCGSPNDITLEYKVNSDNWETYTIGSGIELNDGESVSFQATEGGNSTFSIDYDNFYQFTTSGEGTIAASGNIMSLLDKSLNLKSVPADCFLYLFCDCSNLVSCPKLPATTLASECYSGMFSGCTSLTQAPELPATTLAEYCYFMMFYGSSLTQAPELPATTLAHGCYYYMFSGCSNLATAPELPAKILDEGCYCDMFYGCTSLTQAPDLPATTLASACYSGMFRGCTSLTQAPDLPATTLASNCYSGMFWDCALAQAPDLPATILEPSCYSSMFYGCTSLVQAPKISATTLAVYCCSGMFHGCTSLTQAPELPATTLAEYCYFMMFYGSSLTQAPELPATTLAHGCYYHMFADCPNLTTAPKSLPATTLATSCYYGMFSGCTSLTTVPKKLPATTLYEQCYRRMFLGCTSLTAAPELPATTLASECYSEMFAGCSNLSGAPELPATVLASGCYSSMFSMCSNLTQSPELPATTLEASCYSCMFYGCTNITQSPELPATTLEANCYSCMFYGCTNLNRVTCKATNIEASDCCYHWLEGVSSLGTFFKAQGMSWPSGSSGIPSGWTVQEE